MSQSKLNRRMHNAPPTTYIGHNITKKENGEEQDLSGQLPQILVGHPRHAGASHEEAEKLIASQRDSSPALNKAIPVIADSSADRNDYSVRTSGTLDGKKAKRKAY
jgi:hypothetical protein